MTRLLSLFALTIMLYACSSSSLRPKTIKNKGLVVAIQPLQYENQRVLDSISHYIKAFYGAETVLLENKTIPDNFIDRSKGLRYSANEIIAHLKESIPDTVSLIVGVTGNDIFTTKKDKDGNIKKPEYKYAVWGIFGLGYRPGKSCVISTHRLKHANKKKTFRRIRTVVLHEVGHNLGLKHCKDKKCIMTDANETIATIDNSSDDICEKCKAQLKTSGYIK